MSRIPITMDTQHPKVHKIRFREEESLKPGKYRKEHEVSTPTSIAAQVVVWVDTIVLDKSDIEFLMESEA